MKSGFLLLLLFFFLLPIFQQVNADSLIIRSGKFFILKDDGTVRNISSFSDSNVLGTTSGVAATVTVSLFAPTNTPTPTNTPAPTNTPTPTRTPTPTPPSSGSSSPTNTPTPTNTPAPSSTPTPAPTPNTGSGLITVAFNNGTETVVQDVTQVVLEDDSGNTIVTITSKNDGENIILDQNGTKAESSLRLEIDTEKEKVIVVTEDNNKEEIILPEDALNIIKEQGTFIIPDTIEIELIEDNGTAIYRIKGLINVQIFGLFTIKLPVIYYVQASDGRIIKYEESFFIKLLKFLRIGKPVIQ